MSGITEFDYGAYLGIGLDNNQIAYLAGALFLGFLAVSALRHAKQAGGIAPSIWIAISIGLFAGTLIAVARGFPEELPDFLKPWADADRVARLAAILALLGLSVVLISAHWVRGGLSRFWYRTFGFAVAGLAVWLAVGWFGEEIPDEARPWTAQRVIIRAVVVLGILSLAVALWVRGNWSTAHVRWANRALVPLVLAIAVVLVSRWFVAASWADFPLSAVELVTAILAIIASASFLLIAGGALFLVDHQPAKKGTVPSGTSAPKAAPAPAATPSARLPVAMLIDENGQPMLPKKAGQAGPAGA